MTTDGGARVHAVVGILRRGDRVLMQQRRGDQDYGGQWEFPGGKVEPGETAYAALTRELNEELGVRLAAAEVLRAMPVEYAHARVWLEVFTVAAYQGVAAGREGQTIRWVTAADIKQLEVLKAVPPILQALGIK